VRRREDVLDLRAHQDQGLEHALALGLRSLSVDPRRDLVVLVGERDPLPRETVRLLSNVNVELARDGRRCALVMPAATAIGTMLTHRATLPWAGSREEAQWVLRRQRPAVRIRRGRRGRELRATLSGDLDLAGLHVVIDKLRAIGAAAGPRRRIVIDLEPLRFVDPHGLEAITRVVVRAQLAGSQVLLVNASRQLRALAYRLGWHRSLPGLDGPSPHQPVALDLPAVIATNLRGTVLHWNAEATALYHWPREDILGQSISTVTVPSADGRAAGDVMRTVRDRGGWEGHFTARRSDDTTFPAHVLDAVIDDGLGTPVGIVGLSAPSLAPHGVPT